MGKVKDTVVHLLHRKGHRDQVVPAPALPPAPRPLIQVQQEYQQVCSQIGHHTRQKDIVLPQMISELNARAALLESEAQVISEKEAQAKAAAVAKV